MRLMRTVASWRLAARIFSSADAQTAHPDQTVRIVNPPSPPGNPWRHSRRRRQLARCGARPVIVENKPSMPTPHQRRKLRPDGYTLISASNGHHRRWLTNLNGSHQVAARRQPTVASVRVVLVVAGHSVKDVKEFRAGQEEARHNEFHLGRTCEFELSRRRASEANRENRHCACAVPRYAGTIHQPDARRLAIEHGLHGQCRCPPFIQGGQIKALAIATSKRVPQLPDVPTMAEAGMPNTNTIPGSPSWRRPERQADHQEDQRGYRYYPEDAGDAGAVADSRSDPLGQHAGGA